GRAAARAAVAGGEPAQQVRRRRTTRTGERQELADARARLVGSQARLAGGRADLEALAAPRAAVGRCRGERLKSFGLCTRRCEWNAGFNALSSVRPSPNQRPGESG